MVFETYYLSVINKLAQSKITLKEGLLWFDTLGIERQRDVLVTTRLALEQSITDKDNGDQESIREGIDLIPLRPTMTPIVLLKTQTFKSALDKIVKLPDGEVRKAFISLVTIFQVTDTKRRNTQCKDGCYHEWHNLDDDK